MRRVIKRFGKEFHVMEGNKTIFVTKDFDEAVSKMPVDNTDYKPEKIDTTEYRIYC